MTFSDADLQEIIRLLDDSDYDEMEVETDRFRLVLRRTEGGWSQQRETLSRPNRIGVPAVSPAGGQAAASAPPAVAAGRAANADEIRAPLFGTFYRAPRPGADPFVEVGSEVLPDTVIAIIEVMKLMYSVMAGVAGEIAEICVEDGMPVEKGQCLMRVRPLAGKGRGE